MEKPIGLPVVMPAETGIQHGAQKRQFPKMQFVLDKSHFITNISPSGCQFSGKTDDLKDFVLNEGSELQIAFQFIGLEGAQSL